MVIDPRWIVAPAIVVCAASSAAHAQAPVGGTVRGSVTDKEFGIPVMGASVTILGSRVRANTDGNGAFTIPNVPPGTYTVVVTKDGFVREVRPNIVVNSGQLSDVDVAMAGEFEDMEEVVVQDINLGQEESEPIQVMPPPELEPIVIVQPGEFTLRLDSPQLLDILGVEAISRSGAGDAAAALLLVPGATLQDGKYAVVRGLPDRYVSVLLDGVRLPVSTPDKRAVQLDQFPSAVIQSIEVSKSFTPDQQGEASGGGVNVVLRDIPDEGILQMRAQIGANSQVKSSDFLTYPGGKLDFWGNNDVLQTQPDLIGQSWSNNPTGTTTGSAPTIYKWSVAGGDSWEVADGVKIGAFGNFFYEQGASYFSNGQLNSLEQAGPGTPLVPEQFGPSDNFTTELFDVTQGTQSVQWGGLASAGLETEEHKLGAKFIYTRLSESQAVLLQDTRGKEFFFPDYNVNDPFGPGNIVGQETQAPWNRLETLDYTQVVTQALIFNGKHTLGDLGPGENDPIPEPIGFGAPTVDWRFSVSHASEDQPDQTQFSAKWQPAVGLPLPPPLDPGIVLSNPQWVALPPAQDTNVGWVQHINYFNSEDSVQGAANIKLPFLQWNDREGYVKAGGFVDSVTRSYTQDTFSNNGDPNTTYEADFSDPWSAVFPSQNHPINQSQFDISYNGAQDIVAGYGMIDLPFNDTMNLVTGVRYETTDMTTTVTPDSLALWIDVNTQTLLNFSGPNLWDAGIDEDRLLPMVGWNWNIMDDLVLRTAFSQTLARPNFFELVPVLQYQYIGGPVFIGNPQLQMSSLNNYDVRLDWTPYEGWLISGSAFYKQIYDPIQYAQRFTQGFAYTTALNFGDGQLFGVELEARVTAEPLFGEEFKGLAAGMNFTYMYSEVQIPEDDAQAFSNYGVSVSSFPMSATPEFLFNANITYDYEPWGTQLGVFFNYQGESLIAAANAEDTLLTPSIYQLGYGTLNATVQQRLFGGLSVSFAAKNITNPVRETEYRSFDGFTGVNSTYTAGVDFQFSLSYNVSF